MGTINAAIRLERLFQRFLSAPTSQCNMAYQAWEWAFGLTVGDPNMSTETDFEAVRLLGLVKSEYDRLVSAIEQSGKSAGRSREALLRIGGAFRIPHLTIAKDGTAQFFGADSLTALESLGIYGDVLDNEEELTDDERDEIDEDEGDDES